MPELIDRQALIKDMCNNKTEAKCPCYPNCYPCDFSEARRIIDIQPTIEPEVRHGRWIENGEIFGIDKYKCSLCGGEIGGLLDNTKYCCFCGAKMDEQDGGADNG